MTKRKRIKNTRNTEFAVGLLTFLVILGITVGVTKKSCTNTMAAVIPQPKMSKTQITPTPTPTSIENKKKNPQTVTIINGDSYWKIAERACGNGKLFLNIQNQNEDKSLQPGETVTVSCN